MCYCMLIEMSTMSPFSWDNHHRVGYIGDVAHCSCNTLNSNNPMYFLKDSKPFFPESYLPWKYIVAHNWGILHIFLSGKLVTCLVHPLKGISKTFIVVMSCLTYVLIISTLTNSVSRPVTLGYIFLQSWVKKKTLSCPFFSQHMMQII